MRSRDITLIALLSATLTVGKLALSSIPNIEVVTFLVIVYTLEFGIRRSLMTTAVFVTTEILIYGFGTWLLGYYLMWPSLVLMTWFLRNRFKNEYHWAFLSGFYGLSFGLFFALTESVFYGFAYGLAYWIRGIPFDLVHGASNFIVMVILYQPIRSRLGLILKRWNI